MKGTALLFAFILSVALAPAIGAANLGPGVTAEPQPSPPGAPGELGEQPGEQPGEEAAPAERLIVRNPQGVELGEIINFLVDTEVGKVAYALVATGNSVAEEDLRLVPVNALRIENEEIILDMDEQQLANSPTPQPGQDPEEFHRRISDFYGVAPYWEE